MPRTFAAVVAGAFVVACAANRLIRDLGVVVMMAADDPAIIPAHRSPREYRIWSVNL